MAENALTLVWRDVVFPSGATYRGGLDGPRKEGRGAWAHPGGESYEGEYRGNLHHGWGVYRFRDGGKKYAGEWRAGVMDGAGVYYFDRQGEEYYCGTWDGDRKHGEGLFRYGADGRATHQKWQHGELVAEVDAPPLLQVQYFAKRVAIEAMVDAVTRDPSVNAKQGAKDADAAADTPPPSEHDVVAAEFARETTTSTYAYPSGATYRGGFLGSKKHGVGVWAHPSGDKYAGSFRNNKHHGWGRYEMGAGDKTYVGGWDAGKIDGWGVYYLNAATSEYYIGTFRDELKHGVGVHVRERGYPQFQRWKQGELLEETRCPHDILAEYERAKEFMAQQVESVLHDAPCTA
eukprot:TRINITY_DN20833_c0_g1_i1.p1 TRINITY_DN20833_c0_g1~~TRINITY_DN20833_c0_g1_i1.p1  ORF type:complete len:365 (+),score=72.22 TRINITY_DN20833_c0_g1_i1:60-1097(+)